MRILLTTEGTYPYTKGGVSTWTHSLVSGLPHHEFSLMALTANPIAQPIFPVPPNVKLMPVPLWGSELVEEYLDRPHGLRRRLRTKPEIVKSRFLPVFEHLVNELVIANPDLDAVGTCLVAIAQFSQPYDLCQALHDERVWSLLLARFQGNPAYQHTGVGEAVDLARSFYRYLMPLASPLPEVDIVHSSAAALCAFPALIAKITRGTPFVLTEHGVYLRERLLDLVRSKTPTLEKILFSNFFRGIVLAAYRNADRIVPVCYYNAKWEMELGVEAEGVSVIHNGVDPAHFPKGHGDPARPTVAYVGRIDPLKDIVTLVRAARLVRDAIPDVLFRIYGPESSAEYGERCRSAVSVLEMEDNVVFEGSIDDVVPAYRDCDLVVLPSMSEGFPFTVVEAMMSGRPVVSTAVGGVPEALDRPSLLVEPQNAPALAKALVEQLRKPRKELRAIGDALHDRALALFTRDRFLSGYDALYNEMLEEEARGAA